MRRKIARQSEENENPSYPTHVPEERNITPVTTDSSGYLQYNSFLLSVVQGKVAPLTLWFVREKVCALGELSSSR